MRSGRKEKTAKEGERQGMGDEGSGEDEKERGKEMMKTRRKRGQRNFGTHLGAPSAAATPNPWSSTRHITCTVAVMIRLPPADPVAR